MDFDKDTAWLTAAAAALGSVGAWLLRFVEWRGKARSDESGAREKRESALYERQDEQLDRCWKRVAALEEEIARERAARDAERAQERAERERLEADRDRGWGKARTAYDMLHEQRHRHVNTIQAGLNRPLTGDELLARMPPRLPDFAEIAAKGAP